MPARLLHASREGVHLRVSTGASQGERLQMLTAVLRMVEGESQIPQVIL